MKNSMRPKEFWSKENEWAVKPILICVALVFIAVGITAYFTVDDQMDETQKTEEYRMALEYLQSQTFIQEKYGSETPTYIGRHYSNYNTQRYVFTFMYNYVPVLNLGDRYDIELNYIDGKWVVMGFIDPSDI